MQSVRITCLQLQQPILHGLMRLLRVVRAAVMFLVVVFFCCVPYAVAGGGSAAGGGFAAEARSSGSLQVFAEILLRRVPFNLLEAQVGGGYCCASTPALI
jgi:hypothetical protein